jgi:hypothetical protein
VFLIAVVIAAGALVGFVASRPVDWSGHPEQTTLLGRPALPALVALPCVRNWRNEQFCGQSAFIECSQRTFVWFEAPEWRKCRRWGFRNWTTPLVARRGDTSVWTGWRAPLRPRPPR